MPQDHPEQPRRIDLPGADLQIFEQSGVDDQALLRELIDHTPWRSESLTLFGKTYLQPRLIAYHGDPEASYTYSGKPHTPLPWTETLARLRTLAQNLAGTAFNSVLLNYYRDGSDSMGLHADDEPELGHHPVIASLSLGQQRRMYFQHKRQRQMPKLSLELPSGSLLIMAGATQHNWKHGIRKTRRPCGPRVNLTFRLVRSSAE